MKNKIGYFVYNMDVRLVEGLFETYEEALRFRNGLSPNYALEIIGHEYATTQKITIDGDSESEQYKLKGEMTNA